MKLNSTKFMFLMMILLGLLISSCSNNWLLIWCGLEISLISFLPLMSNTSVFSSESTIKYFIIQSLSSAMLIIGLVLMMMMSNMNYYLIMMGSLLMKMGVSPFHNWMLTVIEPINLFSMFILLTVLKIAPLILMSYLNVYILSVMIYLTLITGSVMGLNQNSIRKILGYSSIYNMGFMLSVINFNEMWLMYIIIYTIMILTIIYIMNQGNFNFTNQLVLNQSNLLLKMSLWTNLLSMGGMPPMLGFTIKLMVLEYMIYSGEYLTLIFMIITSLLVMFFYNRMTFISLVLSSYTFKCSINSLSSLSIITIIINILPLPMIFFLKSLN